MARHTRLSLLLTALVVFCTRVEALSAASAQVAAAQSGGSESVTLTSGQVGSHAHALMASQQVGSAATPGPTVALSQNAQTLVNLYGTVAANTTLSPGSIGPAGGSQPHENRQPELTINYIIAFEGIYPSQN